MSLKRSADPDGGQEWQLRHFSSANFAGDPSPDTRISTVCEDVEMDPFDPTKDRLRSREP